MKRFWLLVLTCGATALAADPSKKLVGGKPIDGWISDSQCGAMHAGSGAACVKKCISGGAKPVFVDDAKKQVWTIDDPDVIASQYGHHVEVSGSVNLAEKTVHIASVSVLKDQGNQGKSDEMGGMSH
jgi:hypothetical protein